MVLPPKARWKVLKDGWLDEAMDGVASWVAVARESSSEFDNADAMLCSDSSPSRIVGGTAILRLFDNRERAGDNRLSRWSYPSVRFDSGV